MKILLIAENGYTENALAARFRVRDRAYLSVSAQALVDIDDMQVYLKQQNISVIINTATASLLKIPSWDFVAHLAILKGALLAADQLKIPFIQLSNSRVFGAEEGRKHRETDELGPSTAIGEQYQTLETLVKTCCSRHIILRVSTLLGVTGENALTILLQRLEAGGELDLYLQGNNAPVHVDDFSRVVMALVDQLDCGVDEWANSVWGDYHYVSSDPTTHYHFAETVLAAMSQYASTVNVSLSGNDDIDKEWRRPLLNCEKLLNTFGVKQLPWRSSIVAAVRAYFENKNGDIQGALNE